VHINAHRIGISLPCRSRTRQYSCGSLLWNNKYGKWKVKRRKMDHSPGKSTQSEKEVAYCLSIFLEPHDEVHMCIPSTSVNDALHTPPTYELQVTSTLANYCSCVHLGRHEILSKANFVYITQSCCEAS